MLPLPTQLLFVEALSLMPRRRGGCRGDEVEELRER